MYIRDLLSSLSEAAASGMKPLLAGTLTENDYDKINFPVIASPKIDGIRCLKLEGGLFSRQMKLIPNVHIQSFANEIPDGIDGELVVYNNGKLSNFNTAQSQIMSKEGAPEWAFFAFDDFSSPSSPYTARLNTLELKVAQSEYLHLVETHYVNNVAELNAIHKKFVSQGWEGTMIRRPDGIYKKGRSTVREGILLKIKDFLDDEALVMDVIQAVDKNGTPKEELGAVLVSWVGPSGNKIEFRIGSGFKQVDRKEYWNNPDLIINQKVTFKYQELSANGVPRFPTFLGIRYDK